MSEDPVNRPADRPADRPAEEPPDDGAPVLGRSEHRFRTIAPLLFAALVALAGLFGYWLLDNDPPLENMTGKVVSVEVHPDGGAQVIVEWMAMLRRVCHGNSIRWIINGYITPLPDIAYPPTHPADVGRVIKWRVPIAVPKDFHDTGAYRVRVGYECNPLHRLFPIVLDPPDVPFHIDRPEPAP